MNRNRTRWRNLLNELRARETSKSKAKRSPRQPQETLKARRVLVSAETATVQNAPCILDRRPPQEVQFALERELMTLFTKAMDNGKLRMLARKATSTEQAIALSYSLRAALFFRNSYSRVEASWAGQPAKSHDYFARHRQLVQPLDTRL